MTKPASMSRFLVLAVSTVGLAAGATGWSTSASAAAPPARPAVVSPNHPNPGPNWVWVRDYGGAHAEAACIEGMEDLSFQDYGASCLPNLNSPIWSLFRSKNKIVHPRT
jgi:hypothetical protein